MRILRLREVRSHSQEEAKLGRNPELSDPPLDPSPCQVFSTLEFAKVGLATAWRLPPWSGLGDKAQREQTPAKAARAARCRHSLLSVCSPVAQANGLLRIRRLWNPQLLNTPLFLAWPNLFQAPNLSIFIPRLQGD